MWRFPTELFSFPLNLICCILWIAADVSLYRHRSSTRIVRFMLSPAATYTASGLLMAACLIIGFTGKRELTSSWGFAAILFFFLTVLLSVTVRGWRKSTAENSSTGQIRWRFILLHAGLLIALGSGFWGAPDKQVMRMKAYRSVPTNEAWLMDGRQKWLPYTVCLEGFEIRTYDDGTPEFLEARLLIDEKPVSLKVNHPYSTGFGEDVCLSSYNAASGNEAEYCIIQITRDPWKYGKTAGITLLLAGVLLLFIKGPDRASVRYKE